MPPLSPSSKATDDDISVDTQDALDVVNRIGFIMASLEKASVPLEELQHFKSVVNRIPFASCTTKNDDPGTTFVSDGRKVVAEGTLEKLQKGMFGFAPVWKPRWIRVFLGEMQVFESRGRPKPEVSCLFSLPLSVQQTKIDLGNEALCKMLGKEAILMVGSTTSVGGTLRCVTLAVRDDLALEKWTKFLEKAMSQEGYVKGASIFRASQTGDILRVKKLIMKGTSVNCPNAYGCVPLHYAVKNAAECATVVARGGREQGAQESKMRAQESLRVIVFLMSHGADARAVNNLGETPLEIGSRLTCGFPKSRSLLLSILDSSKYQSTGGAMFIVPGKPQLISAQDESYDDVSEPQARAVTARGLMFSPSGRNRRAKTKTDIAEFRRPCTSVPALSSLRVGPILKVSVLPRGDHEVALGGLSHCFAASIDSHRRQYRKHDRLGPSRGRKGTRNRGINPSSGGGTGLSTQGREVAVMFSGFRLGKSSAMFMDESKRKGNRTGTVSRPATSPAGFDSHMAPNSCMEKPLITSWGTNKKTAKQDAWLFSTANKSPKRREYREERGGRRRAEISSGHVKPLSMPDSEARRKISGWLRDSAGTASAVPPAAAHGAGEYLVETSSYVAASHRSDVYNALKEIKGKTRGELISNEKLRNILCRIGQPLLTHEMDELLREADPGETGYVSCSRFSAVVAGGRLAPLAKGTTYNEEDDVVLKAKARHLARSNGLERAAANAQAIARKYIMA